MGDALRKSILKNPIVRPFHRRKSSQEIAELILRNDPDASMEMIGNVISEWGELLDGHVSVTPESTEPDLLNFS
jgi:hypothetical protein